MEKKSLKYEYIKFALLIFVIIGHATRMYTINSAFPYIKTSAIMTYITNFIYGFHMPIFFIMSGAIFYLCLKDKNKYQNKKDFIFKKIKRLLIPYIFIGITFLPIVMINTHITTQNYIEYVFYGIILAKNNRHLWYLLYLFIYFVEFIFYPKKEKTSNFIIYTIFCLIIYKLKISYISDILYWSIFFYMGIMLHKYFDDLLKINKFLIIIMLVGYSILVYYDFSPMLLKLFGSVLFILIFLNVNIIKHIPKKIYTIISNNSMGIYLFHPLILYLIYYYLGTTIIMPILLPLSIVMCLLISVILSELFKRIKLNFLLGN